MCIHWNYTEHCCCYILCLFVTRKAYVFALGDPHRRITGRGRGEVLHILFCLFVVTHYLYYPSRLGTGYGR